MESSNAPPGVEPGPLEPRLPDLGFPIRRQEVTLTDLLSRASEAWSRDLGTWVLAMLLYWLIGMGIPFSLNFIWGFVSAFQQGSTETGMTFGAVNIIVQIVLYLVQLVLSAVFTLGLWAMATRGLHGESTTVGVLFSQLSKIWKYILQLMAISLAGALTLVPVAVIVFLVFVGPVDMQTPMNQIIDQAGTPFLVSALALLPVYVYVMAGIAFMQVELAFNDDAGPLDAIVYSWRIAYGKRWRIIGVGLVASFIMMGSAMMCGVGLVFGAPFATLLFGALYLALRNGAEVPTANTATTLGRRY